VTILLSHDSRNTATHDQDLVDIEEVDDNGLPLNFDISQVSLM
jgi:hypothetical protein